jgi:hypothetical protein
LEASAKVAADRHAARLARQKDRRSGATTKSTSNINHLQQTIERAEIRSKQVTAMRYVTSLLTALSNDDKNGRLIVDTTGTQKR